MLYKPTVATDIAKAAEFEHCAMSSSCAMIFFTLATGKVSTGHGAESIRMTYGELWRSR